MQVRKLPISSYCSALFVKLKKLRQRLWIHLLNKLKFTIPINQAVIAMLRWMCILPQSEWLIYWLSKNSLPYWTRYNKILKNFVLSHNQKNGATHFWVAPYKSPFCFIIRFPICTCQEYLRLVWITPGFFHACREFFAKDAARFQSWHWSVGSF